jgi:ribosomal protein S18 acetylase RimI-like enzyme
VTSTAVRIRAIDPSGPLFEGAIVVYADAFARPPYSDLDRGREVRARIRDTHRHRKGFRFFIAEDNGAVLGMAYGYHGEDGQWWHDAVARWIGPRLAERWLSDAFEVVEVAVAPAAQGQGIGTALVTALVEGRPERTAVLSTRTDSRAHELYARLGFEYLAQMTFTAAGWPFYVMGRPLP